MVIKLILSCFLTIAATATLAESRVIRAVVHEWAPFGGTSLYQRGISLDVITTVLTRAGYTVETHVVPWERAMGGIEEGRYDVIGNLFFHPPFEKFLTYSEPFYQSDVHFVQRRGSGLRFSELADLEPYSIAVGAGFLYEVGFDNADYLQKQRVTTINQGLRMVAGGRVDLTLDSLDVINFVLSQEDQSLHEHLEIVPEPLATQNIHMAVRNDLPDRVALLSRFNQILSEMSNDGSLNALFAQHQY